MRTLKQAELAYAKYQEYASFITLRRTIQDHPDELSNHAIRSLSWKALLLTKSFETDKLESTLHESRDVYTEMRTRFMRNLQHPDELDSFADPLSEDTNSPWNALRSDETMRQEIQQDVDRCMPENLYFRQPSTQDMLVDILFVWSKLNQDIGYRQGMHEVLAPVVWVVERDAIDSTISDQEGAGEGAGEGAAVVFNKDFIEHDSFTLFNAVMRNVKSAYDTTPPAQSGRPDARQEPPMVRRARTIMDVYLERVDPPLAAHLRQIEIVPQVFLMKWVRLLFGREFTFDQTLVVWDSLFAHDSSLQCVDLVCVSMLLRVRWDLMDADYNTAMALLLKYPPLQPTEQPSSLVFNALYLQKHLDFDGGYHVIGKQTNKPPPLINRPATLTLQHQRTASDLYPHKETPIPSPKSGPTPGGLEGLVQDAARSVLARSEKLGISKAVRDAVGEVKKNVSNFQHSRSASYAAEASSDRAAEDMLGRINALEQRNKVLSKMLQGAVDDLWKQHKDVVESRPGEDERTRSFTMAIAKVQLAAVYLDDSSIPLPQEELDLGQPSLDEVKHAGDRLEPAAAAGARSTDSDPPARPALPPKKESTTPTKPAARPSLEQSSFSWMLGQERKDHHESARNVFMSASPFTIRDSPSRRSNSFLFGQDSGSDASTRRGSNSGNAKDKRPQKEKYKGIELDSEDEMVHLGLLK